MTHIYIVLLCGSAITKLAEKRQNNCGKEKKKWKHPAYLRKERKQLLKREKNVETLFLFEKREKTIAEKRERKMWKHLAYVRKRDKTIAKKRKHVETSCLKGKEKHR